MSAHVAMHNSWILRLPGLRRFREQLRRMERLRARAERQHRRIEELESRLAQEKKKTSLLERLQPSTQPVEQMLGHRHQALLQSPKRQAALAREAEFAARTHTYRSEPGSGETALVPGSADQVRIAGVTFWVPRGSQNSGGLANRIAQRGWLPFGDILNGRELGLGTVMLDIGANIGTTSIPRVIAGDVEWVYAAEPDPLNYACLVRNVHDNALGGFVLPERVAISDVDGEALLERTAAMGTQQLVPEGPGGDGRATAADHVRVATLTLDSWVRRLGVAPELVAVVKSDTQGWESRVLAGARQLLTYPHIAWIVEFSPGHLVRARSGPEQLVAQIQQHFTHFVDLRGGSYGSRVKEVGELGKAMAYVTERREKRYTDLLLYRAA